MASGEAGEGASEAGEGSGPFGPAAGEALEHLNGHHEDTVAFMARVLVPCPELRDAAITRLAPGGLELRITDAAGKRVVHLPFAHRAASLPQARQELLGLVDRARRESGEAGATSIEREMAARAAIRTFVTGVARVERITPRMLEITVAGGLESFTSLAPDQFVYLLAPPRGRRTLPVDSGFSWRVYEELPPPDRPIGAYYTVRRFRLEAGEIDLWIVLHDEEGDGAWWAGRAAPGDPVALWGPRTTYARPADAGHLLLVGDETAVPAVAAILESLGPRDRATVLLEVADRHEAVPLRSPAEVETTWLWRQGAPAGSSQTLLDVVRALPLPEASYAWGGGEARLMSAIRKHLRDDRGLPRSHVSMTGYWRLDPS